MKPNKPPHSFMTEQLAELIERLRDMIGAAYHAGATDVHNAWIDGKGQAEADFGEATSDYLSHVTDALEANSRPDNGICQNSDCINLTNQKPLIKRVVRDISELPDYTSPDNQPDLLQCTVKELSAILEAQLEASPGSYADGVEAAANDFAEAMSMAHELVQEAKGADGPKGGFVTDHLDAAENWMDKAEAAFEALTQPTLANGELIERLRAYRRMDYGADTITVPREVWEALLGALQSCMASLGIVYMDWDGEPEDMIHVQDALKAARQALARPSTTAAASLRAKGETEC